MKHVRIGGLAAAMLALCPTSVSAQKPLSVILNWTPGGDHAPIYYALEKGWYKDAGINLTVDSGKGSAMAAQAVGAGATPIGIAELATAFVAKGKGADVVAVMSLYANSPFTFYWKKSSGISGPKNFPKRSIGNPPADAARVMWPAFAEAAGIPKDSVEFVNLSPQAKVPALAAGRVDIISDFWNGHDLKLRELGADLQFIRWSELGLNPYGNSFIVNGKFLKENRDLVKNFTEVTQRAYRTCVDDAKPCIDALLKNASGLDRVDMENQWKRVKELMADKHTTTVALGYLDREQVAKTYDLVKKYFDIDKPFDPNEAFTSEFLRKDVRMQPQ